jgi:hypothetical protein
VRNKTNALTNLAVVDKVDGLLCDAVAPAVVAEYLIGNGDRAPALQIRHLLPSARRPLAAQANRTHSKFMLIKEKEFATFSNHKREEDF